jgi:low temperature requirement protein LtrA
MVSRLILVAQYSTIIWHIRHFREGKIPLAITTGFHFIAAMVYLGVGFRFQDGVNSRVFIAWYVIGGVETLLNLGLSLYSKVLSFNGTHLTERMTVATVIILGEGVISIAKTVAVIVKNDAWSGFNCLSRKSSLIIY